MHASSMANMRALRDRYVAGLRRDGHPLRVADVGSADVSGGTYRDLFSDAEYVGLDLAAGPGVDVVLSNPYAFPLPAGSLDLVISGQTLEHVPQFWRTFAEMVRVLRPGGMVFLIVPSAGPIHRYPVDCYRFLPDALGALAAATETELVDWWRDDAEPWRDLVGAFRVRAG